MSTSALPLPAGSRRTGAAASIATIAACALSLVIPAAASAQQGESGSPETLPALATAPGTEAGIPAADAEVLTESSGDLARRVARILRRPHFTLEARLQPTPAALIASGKLTHDKFTRIGMISVTTKAPGEGWSFPKICEVSPSGYVECSMKVRQIPGTIVSVSYRRLGVWSFPLQHTYEG